MNNIVQKKSKAATTTGQDIPSLGLLTVIPAQEQKELKVSAKCWHWEKQGFL